MDFASRLKNLNQKQKHAVETTEGPVMVIAGPGTGKTELLSMRAANILRKTDTLPENILCLTFTESGQTAMRERLVGIIGKDAYKVAIHTFHSFGSETMAHNREFFYRNALFEPADELKQYEVMRGIFETLPHSSSLSSSMNGEYTHLADTRRVISELKRQSALTSDELLAVIDQSEAGLDHAEKLLQPILSERVSAATGAKLAQALDALRPEAAQVVSLHEVTPLLRIVVESLESLLLDIEAIHPTKPITAWKSQWFERNDAKELVFKDRKRLKKLRDVAYVYYEYLNQMEQRGLYDYDDMVMQVVHALEVHDDLRYNLQEKYLYIMVDEFQDTNLAQLRILHALTNNPVNEGAPNILVVGDDDQAVYGFQGADVSNVLNFSETYPSRELIVLTDNYRSRGAILQHSRAVITQGGDRLETRIPELSKELTARRDDAPAPDTPGASGGPDVPGEPNPMDASDVPAVSGIVRMLEASTIADERATLAAEIATRIADGADPSSIAVLARRHADIQSLLPYLRAAGVPIRYERQESVLDSEPIKALELVARVVLALAQNRHDDANALLPELLAHPAWQLDPAVVWRLSLTAYTNRQQWLEVMATTPEFIGAFTWLLTCAQQSTQLSLEPMLDTLMGAPQKTAEAAEDDALTSPFFDYFFSDTVLAQNPEAYISHLNALRTIRSHLREYQPGEVLTLAHLVEFIDLRRRLNMGIVAHQYSVSATTPAVQLLTAHKSKGLEFDTVYVFSCIDSIWGETARSVSRSINYPKNLPFAPTGNSADERLRLFYVAMTRAKNELVMTYSTRTDTLGSSLRANFLVDSTAPVTVVASSEAIEDRQAQAELAWWQPLVAPSPDLAGVLAPYLETFKLSATSLNNFLDVTRGGPRLFLLNNLLRFPQAKAASAAYGTAIHWTLAQALAHLIATGEQKPLEDSLHDFEQALEKERLSAGDHAYYVQQGSEHLPIYLSSGALALSTTQKPEVGFSHQPVRVGDALLTGSLDMIDVNTQEHTMEVTDYKTGHPATAWDKGDDRTKQKLHRYRQQLLFYKVLVEKSTAYSGYTVTKGQLAFIEPTRSGETIVLPLDIAQEDTERTELLIQAVWKHIMTFDFPDTSHYSPDLKGMLAFEQDLIDEVV